MNKIKKLSGGAILDQKQSGYITFHYAYQPDGSRSLKSK